MIDPCFPGGRKTSEFLTMLEILSSGYWRSAYPQRRLLKHRPLLRTENSIPCNLHLKTALVAKYASHKRSGLQRILLIF